MSKSAMDKTCETCKYYDPNPVDGGSGDEGRCRRNPPQILQMVEDEVLADETPYAAWPVINYLCWCGEHTPKEQEQPDAN